MVTVLPAVEKAPTFGHKLGLGVGRGLEMGQQMYQQHQQKEDARKLLGEGFENLSPDFQKLAFEYALKSKLQGEKPLNPLQEAQRKLAEARAGQVESQQSFFDNLMKRQGNGGEKHISPTENYSADDLEMLSGFAGQPGQQGIVGNIAKGQLEKREKAEKREFDEKKIQRKEALDFHHESQKYDEELLDSYKRSINQIQALDNIDKAISSGKVKPSSLANIFKGFGQIGNKIADALLSGDEATILGSIPYLIEGWKDIFGVRLSDADLRVIQDKLPNISKSPEANKSIMNIMRKYADMSKLRYEIGSQIKKENKGIRPLGYQDQIEMKFMEMNKPVKIRNPNTGNIVPIPAYKASDYIKAGGVLVDE